MMIDLYEIFTSCSWKKYFFTKYGSWL